MKTILILVLLPLCVFAQNPIKVSDLVGNWYSSFQQLNDCEAFMGPFSSCNYAIVSEENSNSWISIYQSGSNLIIKTIRTDFPFFRLMYDNCEICDSIIVPIINGYIDIEYPSFRVLNENEINVMRLDRTPLQLYRNKGDYDRLLLSQNSIRKSNCDFSNSDVLCLTVELYDQQYFKRAGDTLILIDALNKTYYLFDDGKTHFYDIKKPTRTLKYNAQFNQVVFGNGKDSIIVDFTTPSKAKDNNVFAGYWTSTSRKNKYFKIGQELDLETNTLDSLKDLLLPKFNSNDRNASLYARQILKAQGTIYEVPSNIPNQPGSQSLYFETFTYEEKQPQIFMNKKISQWLEIKNNFLVNVYTGEEFSRSTDIDQNIIANDLFLYPNPIIENKIKMIGTSSFHYDIVNISGIKQLEGVSNSGEIDVTKLNPGTYLVQITTQNRTKVFKITK